MLKSKLDTMHIRVKAVYRIQAYIAQIPLIEIYSKPNNGATDLNISRKPKYGHLIMFYTFIARRMNPKLEDMR